MYFQLIYAPNLSRLNISLYKSHGCCKSNEVPDQEAVNPFSLSTCSTHFDAKVHYIEPLPGTRLCDSAAITFTMVAKDSFSRATQELVVLY